jgi:hypothetical protein
MFKYKQLIAGVIIGASITTATGAYASVGDKLEAIVTQFNFVVNGKSVVIDTPIVTIADSSYLPVRTISNILGYDITYKADSRTIELNNTVGGGVYGATPSPSPTVTPSPVPSNVPTTPTLTSSNGVNFQLLKDYYSNSDSSSAIQINSKVYVSLRDGAEHYKIYDISWDEQTKNVVFSKSLIRIPVSQTFGEFEGFIYQGTTYVKESYFANFK